MQKRRFWEVLEEGATRTLPLSSKSKMSPAPGPAGQPADLGAFFCSWHSLPAIVAWTKTEKVLRQHSTHGVKWLGRKRQRVKKDSRCRQRLQRESFFTFCEAYGIKSGSRFPLKDPETAARSPRWRRGCCPAPSHSPPPALSPPRHSALPRRFRRPGAWRCR